MTTRAAMSRSGVDSPDEDALVELPLQGELLGRGHRALAVIHIAVLALLNTGVSWTVNSRARNEPSAMFSQSRRRSLLWPSPC